MVSEKHPCNNREVPLYFLRKLWVEFILDHHVNYFEIGEFWGVGHGSIYDQQNAMNDPLLGSNPPR